MKNIFFTLATMFCGLAGCTAQSDKFTSLDVADFEKMVADADVVLLDAVVQRNGNIHQPETDTAFITVCHDNSMSKFYEKTHIP